MTHKYEIVYDYYDEWNEIPNIVTYFNGTFDELQEYLERKRENGCCNITWSYLYTDNWEED